MFLGKKKGGLWSLLKGGLYSEGKYSESNFCRGDSERSLFAGGPYSEVASRSGLTIYIYIYIYIYTVLPRIQHALLSTAEPTLRRGCVLSTGS